MIELTLLILALAILVYIYIYKNKALKPREWIWFDKHGKPRKKF